MECNIIHLLVIVYFFVKKKPVFKWCIIVTVINIKLKGPTLNNLQHFLQLTFTSQIFVNDLWLVINHM
jgi:hypothetical protein